MQIILTGATGFVGVNLKKYLKISTKDLTRDDIHLLSPSVFKRGSSIVHLAGKAHDLRSLSNSEAYFEVNSELTKRLYEAFLESEAKKFIFISSVKAVADNVTDILTEERPPSPQTSYGQSKLLAEEYIQSYVLPPGKSYFILRPCMIHGPGNKGNLNLLYKFVKWGLPYPLAAFNNKRSFLSIENLCFVINEILYRDDIPSGIYNVADDDPLSTSEVVEIISKTLMKPVRLWSISRELMSIIAKIGDKHGLPLTTDRLNKLTESFVVSNEKLKKSLAKPLPIAADEGLKSTTLSFKAK